VVVEAFRLGEDAIVERLCAERDDGHLVLGHARTERLGVVLERSAHDRDDFVVLGEVRARGLAGRVPAVGALDVEEDALHPAAAKQYAP
jgi:hypothetical protein